MCYDLIKHTADSEGLIQYDIRPEGYDASTDEDVCVGYCVFRKEPSANWCNNNIHIAEVYINENYRGQQLAQQLLQVVLKDAHAENFTHVTMSEDAEDFSTEEDVAQILGVASRGNIRHVLFGRKN